MTTATVLVATWRGGLFVVAGETRTRELTGQSVRALAPDGRGGALAIVGGHSLRRLQQPHSSGEIRLPRIED